MQCQKFSRCALYVTVILSLMIAGCQQAITPDDANQFKPLEQPTNASLFSILPGESRLVLLVYREGTMARLGHNHVISTDQLYGEIYLADQVSQSAAELRFGVDDLQVDVPALRSEFGAEFPGALDDNAVSGTRRNMLGSEQLDAANWPHMVIRTRQIKGQWPNFVLGVDIAIQDRVVSMELPAVLQRSGDRLVAEASFPVVQTELGLNPFSVMMGALRVRDQIDAHLSIVAAPE